ncbi:MAG: hypothetical protein ACTSUQ_02865 [Candidatus Freyarchaeota archaeon]
MRIGDKLIPDNRLPSLIDAVKTLYGKFAFNEIDDETASRLLGHSTSRSGAYLQKKADLRSFGLIEPRGNIKVTEIGRKVSYPDDPKEEQEGLIQAICNVELWKLIYKKYTEKGLTLPSDFWTDIRGWTGLPPEEAKNAAEIVKKAYLEDTKYIKPKFELEEKAMKMQAGKAEVSTSIPDDALGRVTVKDVGYIDVKDKITYEIAKAYLKIFAQKLGIEEKQD